MSRYVVPSIDYEKYKVVVGWDLPLGTFFAQVYDRSVENEDDQLIVCVGAWSNKTIRTIVEIENAIKPYTPHPHIPLETRDALYKDSVNYD